MSFIFNDLDDIETQLYNQVYHSQNNELNEGEIEILNKESHAVYEKSSGKFLKRYFQICEEMNKETNNQPVEKQQQEPVNQFIFVNSLTNYIVEPSFLSRSQRRKLRKKKNREKAYELSKAKRNSKPSSMTLPGPKNFPVQPETKRRPTESKNPMEVITVTDSEEDESCILVPTVWPQVSIYDSDDEPNSGKEEEHMHAVNPQPPEVVKVDEKQRENREMFNAKDTSSDISLRESTHKERLELLNTPESNSNDFIDNAELQEKQFNFSLHGADFKANDNKDFLKPANPEGSNENYETESSCSTTDINLLKPVVFNEVEFPKEDIFAEANFETFGNFITPQRNSKASKRIVCSTPKTTSNVNNEPASSDSSSESDLEESSTEIVGKRRLPNLSPLVGEKQSKKKTPLKRKFEESLRGQNKKATDIEYALSTSSTDTKKFNNKEPRKRKGLPTIQETSSENVSVEAGSTKIPKGNENANLEDLMKKRGKKRKSLSENIPDNEENEQEATSSRLSTDPMNDGDTLEKSRNESENVEDSRKKNKKRKSISMETVAVNDNLEKTPKTVDNKQLEEKALDEKEETTSKDELETQPQETVTENNNKNEGDLGDNSPEKTLQAESVVSHWTEDSLDSILIIENEPPPLLEVSSESEDELIMNWEKHGKQKEDQNLPEFVLSTFSDSWTEDKDVFYKTIVDVDNFTVENVKKSMSNDPTLWQISDLDKPSNQIELNRRRKFCRKCREKGHLPSECPVGYKTPKCSICGEVGHYETRCYNKLCYQCGKPGDYLTMDCSVCFRWKNSVCNVCKQFGHRKDNCPDLWRRYHATTIEGPPVQSNGPLLKPPDQLWCSGCARQGHIESSCPTYKSDYPLCSPEIYSYQDVYGHNNQEEIVNEINIPLPNQQAINLLNSLRHIQPLLPMQPVIQPIARNRRGHLDFLDRRNPQMNSYNSEFVPAFPNQPMSFNQPLPDFIRFDDARINENVPNPYSNHQRYQYRQEHRRRENRIFSNSNRTQANNDNRNNRHDDDKDGFRRYFMESIQNQRKVINKGLKTLKNMRPRLKQRWDEVRNVKKGSPIYYKRLNMILFGIFEFGDGKRCKRQLHNFINSKDDQCSDRNCNKKTLLNAFNYIFGKRKNPDVNYEELMSKVRF